MAFSITPILFGTLLAMVDIFMMGTTKMISEGKLASGTWLPIAAMSYALEPVIFLKALDYEGMVVTNLVWNLMSNVIVTLQGVLIFGESIKGMRWLGIAMSLVALTILAYTDQ